jgi:PAS domain S-box-containing protein
MPALREAPTLGVGIGIAHKPRGLRPSVSFSRLFEGARGVWLLSGTLAVAAGLVYVFLVRPLPPLETNGPLVWIGLAAAFGLAEVGVIHLHVRNQAVTLSLSEIPLVAGFYFVAPADLVLAHLAGAAVALVLHRHQRPVKLAFNLAVFGLTTSLAVVTFRAITPVLPNDLLEWWLASFAAAGVGVIVSALAITAAISIVEGRLQPGALGRGAVFGLLASVVNTSLALLAVVLYRTGPLGLALLIAPAVVVFVAYRAFVLQRHRQTRLEFLYDCARILQEPSLGIDTLNELLARSRAMFRADAFEILLATGDGQAIRAAMGPADTSEILTAAPPDLLRERMNLLASQPDGRLLPPAAARSAIARLTSGRRLNAIIVPLRRGDAVVGTMMVSGRLGDVDGFDAEDLRLLGTLGAHTAAALENARLLERLAASLADVSQLAAIVQFSDDAILAMTPEGMVTSWNPAAERLFGYRAQEITDQPAAVLVPAEQEDAFARSLRGQATGEQVRHATSTVAGRDGHRVPVSVTLSPVADASGTITGLSAIVRDETERTRAEAATRESAERLRALFQESPVGMGLVGPDMRWIRVNAALSRTLERTDGLIGLRVDDVLRSSVDEELGGGLRRLLDGETSGYTTERRLDVKGRTKWVKLTTRPLLDAATGAIHALCIIEDVTETRIAEARARQNEAEFRRAVLAFTAVREPAGVLRAVLTASREIIEADCALIEVLPGEGSPHGDFLVEGMDESVLRSLGDPPTGSGLLQRVTVESGPVRIRDAAARTVSPGIPSGGTTIRSFLGVPILIENRLLAKLFLCNKRGGAEFTAIDEEVAAALAAQAAISLENARIHARGLELVQRLDSANAELKRAGDAKSQFLASVSHELRTPLHSILVAADLVYDPLFGPLSEDRVRDLGATIQASGRHLLHLIDDLVDLSRIEAGRLELHPSELALGQLLGEIGQLLGPLAAEKGIALDLPQDLQLRIVADPLRLRQVLLNLVANAIKFTGHGGRIWMEVTSTTDATVIEVHDTGIGIAAEHLERAFEPFEQVSGTNSPGAGLGLAISRQLIELHAGRLDVDSTLDVGSVFRVTLPKGPARGRARPAHAPTPRPASATHGRRSVRSVLVVEDDADARELVSEVLRRGGYDVVGASCVDEALGHLAGQPPSLVLLDLRLGEDDGLDVAGHVRSTPTIKDLPVLAMSADATQYDIERVLAAGCDGYLTKPISARELLNHVDAILSSPRPHQVASSRSSTAVTP